MHEGHFHVFLPSKWLLFFIEKTFFGGHELGAKKKRKIKSGLKVQKRKAPNQQKPIPYIPCEVVMSLQISESSPPPSNVDKH